MLKKIIFAILITLTLIIGVFLFVYGEYDDSPGGQLLGLVMIVIGVVVNYRCQTSVKCPTPVNFVI